MRTVIVDHPEMRQYWIYVLEDQHSKPHVWVQMENVIDFREYEFGTEPPVFVKWPYELYESFVTTIMGDTHTDPTYLKDTQQVRDRLLSLVEQYVSKPPFIVNSPRSE